MSHARACTSFALPGDEPLACNARARELELIHELSCRPGFDEAKASTLVLEVFARLKDKYSSAEWARMSNERDAWRTRTPDEYSQLLASFAGDMFFTRRLLLDIEDGTPVHTENALIVLDDGQVQTVDYSQSHKWHVPSNEREYV